MLAGQGLKYGSYRYRSRNLTNKPVMRFFSHEKLLHLLSITDLYVHAADAEIEAISCIEAFSSGVVPVIADSPKSATPQFALDERSLFKAGDSDELAAKIDYWLGAADERKRMEKSTVNTAGSSLWRTVYAVWSRCLRKSFRITGRKTAVWKTAESLRKG